MPASKLGQVFLGAVIIIIGGLGLKLASWAFKEILATLKEISSAMLWFRPIMEKYPDSRDVLRKLIKLNGHDSDPKQPTARAMGLLDKDE